MNDFYLWYLIIFDLLLLIAGVTLTLHALMKLFRDRTHTA